MMPRRYTHTCWLRFARDRRRRYLARIAGLPGDAQAARIDALVRLEWQALKAESECVLSADREAREFRRLLDRLTGDFERALIVEAPKPPTLAERLMAERAERDRAA